MLSLIVKFLKPRTRTSAEIGVLVIVLLYSFNQYDLLRTERAKLAVAETALKNPKTIEVVRTVKVVGPTRTVYKWRENADGTRESFSEEFTYGWSETSQEDKKKEPASVESVAGKPLSLRRDRFLVGLDLTDFSPNSYRNYTLYGGYSFLNRLDVLAGARLDTDGIEPHVMGVFRF